MHIPNTLFPVLFTAALLSCSSTNASPLANTAQREVIKVVTTMNPLPETIGSNFEGTNPTGDFPFGTAPCGTYATTATDGPCGNWWMSLHGSGSTTTTTEAAPTLTLTEVAVVGVVATVT